MIAADKLKPKYIDSSNKIEALKSSDKLMLVLAVILLPPFLFYYFIYDSQAAVIKKARFALAVETRKFETLQNAAEAAEKCAKELSAGAADLKKIDSLAMEPRLGFQFIDSISYYADKNGLDVKFSKKTPHEIYIKSYAPADEAGQVDETGRFSCKLLPIEIAFRSSAADMMAFFNMMDGFKKVNFLTRKISAVRTDDGNCEVNMILEILIELNFI